jgi:putative ABC transport system permease protein
MNPIVRNFTSTIRRFKLAAILNVLGLSVAFAAFMVIMIQLDYDYNFDKFHKDYDKIFRVETVWKTHNSPIISRLLAESFFDSSPHIISGAVINPWKMESYLHVEKDGAINYYKENSMNVFPEFFDLLNFDFVESAIDGYIAPGNVIIPLSMARKMFGNESALNKQITHSPWGPQRVLAVYRDFPKNSIFENYIYFIIMPDMDKGCWHCFSLNAYIRVDDASNAPQLVDNFMRNFDYKTAFGEEFSLEESGFNMQLTPLTDIHFIWDNVRYDKTPKTSRQTLMILFVIAIVIIVIAGINFTNFSTALTPMRIKNINTQKVLGASERTIRLALISEAVIISFLSYLIAILLITLFQYTMLARLVDGDLSVTANPLIFGGTALVALITGLLAGAYPARYMTSFAPALVLKGSFGVSPKGKMLRNTLIGIQFVASFALIIGASFMYLQNDFMQHSSLGYDKEAVLTVDISQMENSRDVITDRMKAYSGIEDVTYSEFLLSGFDRNTGQWGVKHKDEIIRYYTLPVHYTFLKVMGIEVTEGRDFRQEDTNKQIGAFLFNETARKQYNLELNATIHGDGEIIGFTPDVRFSSCRMAMEPMAFYVCGTEWTRPLNYAYIKLKAGTNLREAMSHINKTLAEFTNYPCEVRFYDEILQQMYEKEISLGALISLFGLLAIFISIVGVFGLVVFDSEYRRKEIGIRKVFGASVKEIILMFNKTYFRILLICFVIAAPLAWYAVHRWLENFAYKTPMYWWVYLLAFIAVGLIVVCTVTFQNWRAANDNPVETIKTE